MLAHAAGICKDFCSRSPEEKSQNAAWTSWNPDYSTKGFDSQSLDLHTNSTSSKPERLSSSAAILMLNENFRKRVRT